MVIDINRKIFTWLHLIKPMIIVSARNGQQDVAVIWAHASFIKCALFGDMVMPFPYKQETYPS